MRIIPLVVGIIVTVAAVVSGEVWSYYENVDERDDSIFRYVVTHSESVDREYEETSLWHGCPAHLTTSIYSIRPGTLTIMMRKP